MSLFKKLKEWFRPPPVLPPPPSTRDPSEIAEQLAMLRELSARTGVLFEAQKLQLDTIIWIALPGIVQHELVAFPEDPITKKFVNMVEYKVTLEGRIPQDLNKRLQLVDDYVKFVMGNAVRFRVLMNGQLVYEAGSRVNPKTAGSVS